MTRFSSLPLPDELHHRQREVQSHSDLRSDSHLFFSFFSHVSFCLTHTKKIKNTKTFMSLRLDFSPFLRSVHRISLVRKKHHLILHAPLPAHVISNIGSTVFNTALGSRQPPTDLAPASTLGDLPTLVPFLMSTDLLFHS